MNKLEEVARAMRKRRFERTGRGSAYDPDLPLTANELDDARAAIEAMKVPSFEMVDAFAEAAVDAKAAARADNHAKGRAHPDALAEVEWVPQAWRAAIDAALNEPQP